jgi:hypothetical protein
VCLLRGTFCLHSVFMCFVWIWEQTSIISLYSINWLVFITEIECVYCVVRTEWLNVIHVNLSLEMALPWFWRLDAGLWPRRPVFDPRSLCVAFVVEWQTDRFFPCQYHSTNVPYSVIQRFRKDKRAKCESFQASGSTACKMTVTSFHLVLKGSSRQYRRIR